MKIHPTKVDGFNGTIEELAQRVGRMRYDKVVEFLEFLEEEISRQAEGDKRRGRMKLYLLLVRAKNVLGILISTFNDMVCGPCNKFIKAEKDFEDSDL